MSNYTLPNKLSALLRLAVADAQKCEADPRYKLDMSQWHEPWEEDDGVCSVCMAGAVMAQTLGAPIDESYGPYDFERHGSDYTPIRLSEKFEHIDSMRRGNLRSEIRNGFAWGVSTENMDALQAFDNLISSANYDARGRAPWRFYLNGADLLEAAGL